MHAFRPIWLIARKDLRSYFASPIAYVIMASFLFLMGWMFANLFFAFTQSINQFAMLNMGQKPNLADMVVRPLFGNMNVILLLVVPFITMRLLAEERKDHTVELLLTAPLSPYQIVLGKFLAAIGLLCVIVGSTVIYPLIMQLVARPDWGVVLSCYLGLFFLCCTYVAVGLFWSAHTENQIVAAILTFGTLLFLWLISWAASSAGPVVGDVLTHLSIIGHYTNFAQGMIDTTDVVYYLTFTALGLFLTNISMESH